MSKEIYNQLNVINDIIIKHFNIMFPELKMYEIKAGTDFEVILDRYAIYPKLYWAPVTSVKDADSFIEFCIHINPYVKADIFLLCLFHEIGHIKTQQCAELYESASKVMKNYAKRDRFYYYMAPVERMATEWGLEYLEIHKQQVAEFWNEVHPALVKLNNMIEGDD